MATINSTPRAVISLNGRYIGIGNVALPMQSIRVDNGGGSENWDKGNAFLPSEKFALCRLRQSGSKPSCDGIHAKIGFDGTETASRYPYQKQGKIFAGPALSLMDAKLRRAFARFSDPHRQVWSQVTHSDQPHVRTTFLHRVANCPTRRSVLLGDAPGKAIKPKLPISIGLIEDPEQQRGRPDWLRGGPPMIAGHGFAYELRNRLILCRCVQSKNRPYCDGSHASIK